MSGSARLRSLGRLSEDEAPAGSREMMAALRRNLGMLPNLSAEMAHSPGLLRTYLSGYRDFRTGSGFSATERELVFLSISRLHGCTYCVAAHSATADQAGVPVELTDAVRAGDAIADGRLQELVDFTIAMVTSRGRPTETDLLRFLASGYTERHVLEIILAIALKTMSNYTNHMFGGTPIDEAWAHRAWTPE